MTERGDDVVGCVKRLVLAVVGEKVPSGSSGIDVQACELV